MTLKEYIENSKESHLKILEEKDISYEKYYKTFMKSLGLSEKTPFFKLTKKQKQALDDGWKSKEEKKKES